jgi:hypothetical protein
MSGKGVLQARLLLLADGHKPDNTENLQELERKAVILGALTALHAAGIAPWVSSDTSTWPTLKANADRSRNVLLHLVQQGSGHTFSSLRDAAEWMRRCVMQRGLEETAWNARSLYLAQAAAAAQRKRSRAESATATGLSAANAAAAASVIGLLAVPFISAAKATAIGLSVRSQAETARAELAVKRYTEQLRRSVEQHKSTAALVQLAAQAKALQHTAQRQAIADAQEAQRQAAQQVQLYTYAAWGAGALAVSAAAYWLARRTS